MSARPHVEVWTSSENQSEIHVFREPGGVFLFAFNPCLVEDEHVLTSLCQEAGTTFRLLREALKERAT